MPKCDNGCPGLPGLRHLAVSIDGPARPVLLRRQGLVLLWISGDAPARGLPDLQSEAKDDPLGFSAPALDVVDEQPNSSRCHGPDGLGEGGERRLYQLRPEGVV